MRFKKASMAVMLAVSMASTPVLAQASAAPVRASAEVSDVNEINGGWFIPLLAVLAVVGGIIAVASGGDDAPTSP